MNRASGVLMHVSSLFGDYSAGSFGRAAQYFIDFLADSGFSYWQVLPFNMADDCNSPYKSFGAFSGNPYFIDLEILHVKGLINVSELLASRQNTPYSCEFERLERERMPLLRLAASRADEKERTLVAAFIEAHPSVADFCRFMALKEANGGAEWIDWSTNRYAEEALFVWQFIQYEFYSQWLRVKSYANERGVRIIGDIPIYVAYDSSDVWANRADFQLNEDGHPTAVAGVPPDYFSEDGQLWGNPLYDWDHMATDGCRWWTARMNYMLELFDGVRIDHFRGLEAYWSVPAHAKTAKEGKWVKGPGAAFVNRLRKLAGDRLIIAEDLGDISEEVVQLVRDSGFPGMRVLQFAFMGDEDSPHLPHNYIRNCVAYTGTHDNNTLLGFMWEQDDAARKRVTEYCGYEGDDWDCSYDALIRTMLASHAGLVILPIQDVLHYGSDTRMNIPGKPEGNWRYRITKEQLDGIDRGYYKRLNALYARVNKGREAGE